MGLILILFDLAADIIAWAFSWRLAVAGTVAGGAVALLHMCFGSTELVWLATVLILAGGVGAGLVWQWRHEKNNE